MRSRRNHWFMVGWLLFLIASSCTAAARAPSPTEPHEVTTTTLAPTTTTTVGVQEGVENFRACLSDLGVVIDEIRFDGLGRPRLATAMASIDFGDREVLNAVEECGPQLSGALDLSADPELAALVAASLEEFAECVRTRGVESFPDPVADFDGSGHPFPVAGIPWAEPGLAEAVSVCIAAVGLD